MIPSPPPVCSEGHAQIEPECLGCQDWDNWMEAFNAWLLSDEAGRWLDLNELDEARWEQLQARRAA